jgi:pimeloyl-ACP methyl ester carboxylesterase
MGNRLSMRLCFVLAIASLLASAVASAQTPVPPPVAAVVDGRFAVGGAQLPMFVSQDWSQQSPSVRRVVVIVHGYERNAADYARYILDAQPPDGTLVVAPQFLAAEDISEHHLPDTVLRWQHELWAGGNPADGPAPLSAFDVLDALLARLADRTAFPNLETVVLAGFSAGGQLVQRYAIVGRGELQFAGAPRHLRYVVGSRRALPISPTSGHCPTARSRRSPAPFNAPISTIGGTASSASCRPMSPRWRRSAFPASSAAMPSATSFT